MRRGQETEGTHKTQKDMGVSRRLDGCEENPGHMENMGIGGLRTSGRQDMGTGRTWDGVTQGTGGTWGGPRTLGGSRTPERLGT